jgi:hypothetical protein
VKQIYVCLWLALTTASPAFATTILRFEPSDAVVAVGNTVLVDVVADFSVPIVAFGFDLTIAPALLSLDSAVVGPLWIGVFAPDGDGLAGLTLTSGIVGTGVVLATIELTALAPGVAQMLASITPGDLTEGFGLAGAGFDSVQFVPMSITIVPEPSVIALLGAGLLLIGSVRRLGRRTAAMRVGQRLALLLITLAATAVALASPGRAIAQDVCPVVDFVGDYPKDEELPWSENAQGVAHDADHWFFTQQDALLKLPTNFPLHLDPDFEHSPNGEHSVGPDPLTPFLFDRTLTYRSCWKRSFSLLCPCAAA